MCDVVINMKNHPRYTCMTEEGTYEQRRKMSERKIGFMEHCIECFYKVMVHADHGGGMLQADSTRTRNVARERIVFERFQNNIWSEGKSFEPVTSPEEFMWALNNGDQFDPEEYIIPAKLNDTMKVLYAQEHGLVIGNAEEYSHEQLDEIVKTTAYWFHEYIQNDYQYCIDEESYHNKVIPVFTSILSGKDLVEDWRGREPNWFHRYSGYYLALVEACQGGDVEYMGLSWA